MAAFAALFAGSPARADATFNVMGFWDMGAIDTLPDGVSLQCTGGCYHTLSFFDTISSGHEDISLSDLSEITLVNNGDQSTGGTYFRFGIGVSAFNPGGSEIGVSVDNPAIEFASFFSEVSVIGMAFDSHGCSTSASQPACGVMSPDSNFITVYLLLPAPGQTIDLGSALISIGGELQSVPEPPSIAIALGALLIFFVSAKARRRTVRISSRRND
jgi:hypothetical protein